MNEDGAEFFRVLKTGARIEDRNFDDADDLKRCLAAITAWRVLDRLAREKPDTPAFEVLSDDDIEALYLLLLDQRITTSAQAARYPDRRHGYRTPRRLLAHQTSAAPGKPVEWIRQVETLIRHVPRYQKCRVEYGRVTEL